MLDGKEYTFANYMGTKNKAHKQTAWKKNREFGDKMGGRGRLKLDDNIFAREHSFHAPTELDEVPILMIDNTSRDYYFPVSPDEIKTALSNLPNSDIVTHIWLRKHNTKRDSIVEWIKGSGVYLITLYPLLKENRHFLGKNKPLEKDFRWYSPFANVVETKEGWYAVFTEASAKDFYLNRLIPFGVEGLQNI